MRCLGNTVQRCLSVCMRVCASVCWLIRWCGIKGRWRRSKACRACVNSRVYMSDEVAVVKGDLTGRLCKWWLMGSLESLFSQSNEVHLPGGKNMKDRLWGSDRQLGHLTQPCAERRDGQDGSVVMIPSVWRGGAFKDDQISWTHSHDRMSVSGSSLLPFSVTTFVHNLLLKCWILSSCDIFPVKNTAFQWKTQTLRFMSSV